MKRIFIIEDDLKVARIYQGLLRMQGTEAEVESDPQAALEALPNIRPDLILLDITSAKVTLLDVLKGIRQQPATRDVAVIVFSDAHLSPADQAACEQWPTQWLVKSKTTDKELLRTIRTTLGLKVEGSLVNREPGRRVEIRTPVLALEEDGTFQERSRRALLEQGPSKVQDLRNSLRSLTRTGADEDPKTSLQDLHQLSRTLSTTAALANCGGLVRMCSALEALGRELSDSPTAMSSSSLRTMAQAVDFVGVLLDQAAQGRWEMPSSGMALVVDDEPISRRAVCVALGRGSIHAIELPDPRLALQVLETNVFEVLFLDVDMPGMSGFELCQAVRARGRNRLTPVVFVTGLADFGNRALSIRSGGNDVIAKPFLGAELAVKALLYVLRPRSASLPAAPAMRPSGEAEFQTCQLIAC